MLQKMLQSMSLSVMFEAFTPHNAPYPNSNSGSYSSWTKRGLAAKKKAKNRRRNKIARQSRRINRRVN